MKKFIIAGIFSMLVLSSFLVYSQVNGRGNSTKKIPSCENCKVVKPENNTQTN